MTSAAIVRHMCTTAVGCKLRVPLSLMTYAWQLLGCVLIADSALRMCTTAIELHAERRCRLWPMHGTYWAAPERRRRFLYYTAAIELRAERRCRSPYAQGSR